MSISNELQATLEFCVELHKFYNVDLFLRGFYQLQVSLRVVNTKLPVRVEISSSNKKSKKPSQTPTQSSSSQQQQQNPNENTVTQATSSTTTQPFRILFRNEELELKEIILFRIHFQLELQNLLISKLIDELNKCEYLLDIKLCFNDQVVSSRTLQIHYYINNNTIHYYRPVFFDYFHLAAVTVSVHGGIIAFHLSKVSLTNNQPSSGSSSSSNSSKYLYQPDLIPHGTTPSSSSTSCMPMQPSILCSSTSTSKLTSVRQTHESIMTILLESNSSLKSKLVEFLQVLGKHELIDSVKSNHQITNFDHAGKTADEIEDLLMKAHKQIAQLCAENILLWHRFLDLIIGKDPVRVYLANLHHQLRVKRFSEGFYITENPLRSAYTSKDYTPIVDLLKKSINYSPLPVECTDIDGDPQTIPIVFEDQFCSTDANSTEKICKQKSSTSLMENCNCGIASIPSHSKSLDLKTLKKTSTVPDLEIKKKIVSSASTLPRRHSSSLNKSKKLKPIRKFNSTPLLLNEMISPSGSSSSLTSEESGWVSNNDNLTSSSDEEDTRSIEETKQKSEILPPPIQFQDKINPPELFRDDPKKTTPPCNCLLLEKTQFKPSTKMTQSIPYFLIPDELRIFHPKGLHLIICVHGLDGSCHDLRLFKIYLEVSLPGHNVHFLMSEKNQDGITFTDFDNMTDKFVSEILNYMETNKLNPTRISFVGHSLGNIIIRSALTKPALSHLLPKLYTFLSLSGPHLGTLYNTGIVNMGMWLMQKWKKSCSLLQLSMKDNSDIRKTFLYKLSEKSNLDKFKFVLLCGSSQDRYVPVHSAHIINCKHSLKDFSTQGEAYREMVMNILNPILTNSSTKLIRYDVHHAIQSHTANSIIGRAAHIAVLDSEIFIEKFLSVSAVKFFQ